MLELDVYNVLQVKPHALYQVLLLNVIVDISFQEHHVPHVHLQHQQLVTQFV